MSRDFVGHPLFKAGIAHANLLVCVARGIPAVVAAGATDKGSALATVMLTFEDRKLRFANLTVVASLVWLPVLMHVGFYRRRASFCEIIAH